MKLLYLNGPKRRKRQRELEDDEEYDEDDIYYDDDEYDDWDGYDEDEDYIIIDDPYSIY